MKQLTLLLFFVAPTLPAIAQDLTIYRDSGKIWQYDGNYIFYHENGKPKIKGRYIRNKLHGSLTTWYGNGQIKRKDEYVLDSLVSGHCYTATCTLEAGFS